MDKNENMIVGYTTGVFDLFHIGHLNILKAAKEHCDYLIVGVSVDELVEQYKHRRPVIPFQERIEIVKAIRYVDEVVPQTTFDKSEAWEKLHFDRLFHGDDWKERPEYQEIERKLKEKGVEFVYFPYTKKTSSSKLTEVINAVLSKEE